MTTSAAPQDIEVLIAVDAVTLSEEVHGSSNIAYPTMLTPAQANKYIVMMAPRRFMKNPNPDSNLQLIAVTNDDILWRAVSYAPIRNGVLLMAFNYAGGNQNVISRPQLVPVYKYTKVQRVEDQPQNLTSELYTDSRWQATCKTEGYANYNFTIATTDPGNEGNTKVLGYYKWDPRIDISFG